MSKPRNTTGKGYFTVRGTEPLAKRAVAVRLPESLDAELREYVGKDLSAWLRQAIIDKYRTRKISIYRADMTINGVNYKFSCKIVGVAHVYHSVNRMLTVKVGVTAASTSRTGSRSSYYSKPI